MGVKWRIGFAGILLAAVGCNAGGAEKAPGEAKVETVPATSAAEVTKSSSKTLPAPTSAPATVAAPATRRANTPERADVGSPRGGANPDMGWKGRHDRLVAQAKKGGVDIYFEGDSITEQWLGPGKSVWEKEYADKKAGNFGIGGDKTQHVIYRMENGELDGVDPKLFVLMIGTNNAGSPNTDETAAGVTKIVSIMREKKPNAKILLLAIFPRGADAKDGNRKRNEAVNAVISKLDDGKMIKYLDIGPKFVDKEGNLSKEISPDLLHFNAKGYQIWADATRDVIAEMTR